MQTGQSGCTPFLCTQKGVGRMPKNKVQGIIFGILMSVTMAYGVEVYNVAWKMGIPTMPGGFSNMTNDVFLGALIEAAYMWLFVFLFSSLWETRVGADLAAKLVDPEHDNAFLCTVVLLHGPCHVPDHKPCGIHPLQYHPRRHADRAASCHLCRHPHQELPDGAAVESLCSRPDLAPCL